MAQRQRVVLENDITGEEMESDEGVTVDFGLDGSEYTIDLYADQAEELRELLRPYIAAGRRTGGRAKQGTARKTGGSAPTDRAQNQAIRKWAQDNGYEINDRGRIRAEIVEAYHANAGRSGLAAVS